MCNAKMRASKGRGTLPGIRPGVGPNPATHVTFLPLKTGFPGGAVLRQCIRHCISTRPILASCIVGFRAVCDTFLDPPPNVFNDLVSGVGWQLGNSSGPSGKQKSLS